MTRPVRSMRPFAVLDLAEDIVYFLSHSIPVIIRSARCWCHAARRANPPAARSRMTAGPPPLGEEITAEVRALMMASNPANLSRNSDQRSTLGFGAGIAIVTNAANSSSTVVIASATIPWDGLARSAAATNQVRKFAPTKFNPNTA